MQGAPGPGRFPQSPGRLPLLQRPRRGSRWPVSKEKKPKLLLFTRLGKSTKYNTGAQPGGAGAGRSNVRRFFVRPGPGAGRGAGRGAPIVQPRGPGPSPFPRLALCCAPQGPRESGRPTPLGPASLPSPAGGPGCPAWWGRRSVATVHAGGSHQRGDSGDLGTVLLPGLQILQSKERRVVQTERVGLDGVVEALLEGVVLQLQHEPARLLPLRLPLLRRLPPAPGEGEGQHCHALGFARPPAGPSPPGNRASRPLEARNRLMPAHTCPEVRGAGGRVGPLGFVCAPRGRWVGTLPARPPAHPDFVASPTINLVFVCVCFVTPCGIRAAGQCITDSALRPMGSLGPTGGLAGCVHHQLGGTGRVSLIRILPGTVLKPSLEHIASSFTGWGKAKIALKKKKKN